MDNNTFSNDVWTEAEFTSTCYNPYVKEPFFNEDETTIFLCRENGERKAVRYSSVVFRKKGSEEWEDDLMTGVIEAQALGVGSEEPQPVTLYNLDVDVADFVKVVAQDTDGVTFAVDYPDGKVEIAGAQTVDEGFRITKEQLMKGDDLVMTLTPDDGEAFNLNLTIPFVGLIIRDGEGNAVSGVLDIPFEEIMTYTYSFKGNENDDRFAISFNNDKKIYQYILHDENKLSIRNKKDHMAKVGETDAEGRLALLLQGIPSAVIKHGDQRWRISIVAERAEENTEDAEKTEVAMEAESAE